MTFDDGILIICRTENDGKPGFKPKVVLKEKERFYFGFDTLGINRYYTALQAKRKLEGVVNIPDWNNVNTDDICILEDCQQYRIAMVQKLMDEDNLKYMKLSLERIEENYDFKN